MAERAPKMEDHLVTVPNPCEHGHDLRVLQVPPGAEVYSPTCTQKNGVMRRHVFGSPSPRKKK